MHGSDKNKDAPSIARREDFDSRSGSLLERMIFNNRVIIVAICALLTAMLGYQVTRLDVNASFTKMMPQSHPFIRNYLKYSEWLHGLGNTVQIVVENKKGDIYDPEYIEALRKINDRVYLIPGVDRSFVKSLWMPVVRWTEVTPEGYTGGPVMPDTYDGNANSIDKLRVNVAKAQIVGSLVSDDQKSSMIVLPLLDKYGDSGKPLDYTSFTKDLDSIRSMQSDKITIHIIGFAELMGDLIRGLIQVSTFFGVAALIATLVILLYTRCLRCTVLVVNCSLVAVIWQLGIMRLCGLVLDPFSILVPFLIFAIGVSHGAQKMNGIAQDIGRGTHRYVAARYTFRRLFLAGLTALLADAVGFGVLSVIDIPSIRGLAQAASVGVAVLIFTNLILLPILLSYIGVGRRAAERSVRSDASPHMLVKVLSRLTTRRWAAGVLVLSLLVTGCGLVVRSQIQVGDLDRGAPELRTDSVYNRDVDYITKHYLLSSDQLAVIVGTPIHGLVQYRSLLDMDRLEEKLRDTPGVLAAVSVGSLSRQFTAADFEGSPKWLTISRDVHVEADAVNYVHDSNPELINEEQSVAPIVTYLADHRAETLKRVVSVVKDFASQHDSPDLTFMLAAGSAGIQAATNEAVSKANVKMVIYVYIAVIILCLITFRSWRATVVAVVPLVVTSILCEALMVGLGIGITVATLPVTALGVGIGVDYALYLLTVQLANQRRGMSLQDSYASAVAFTGKVVALVGTTLAAAVVTWAWSPIKFQADMGLLLAFMFVWNMVGALVLLPALSAVFLPNKKAEAVSARTMASTV